MMDKVIGNYVNQDDRSFPLDCGTLDALQTNTNSRRDVLYDVRYGSKEHVLSCEYIAVGVTDKTGLKTYAVNGERGYENFAALLLEVGYVKIAEYEGKLEIYHKEK